MNATNPFQPSKEQIAERVAVDGRIASLEEQDKELLAKVAHFDAQAAQARAKIVEYNDTVVETKRKELLKAIHDRRPLDSELKRIKGIALLWRRRRMRLLSKRASRVARIAQALEEKNLLAQQRQLVKVFRKRRSMSRPEFLQPTQQCESSNTPTAPITYDSSLSTGVGS